MSIGTGWIVAAGTLVAAAVWRSQRPGDMNEERDRAYRECLSGRVPLDEMRKMATAFEKARCLPQARMLRLRIRLEELPEDVKLQRRDIFERAMASQNPTAILTVATAFESEGATTSAAKLRRHAAKLAEIKPVVTPPPPEPSPEIVSDETGPDAQASATNGVSHVAVHETAAVSN